MNGEHFEKVVLVALVVLVAPVALVALVTWTEMTAFSLAGIINHFMSWKLKTDASLKKSLNVWLLLGCKFIYLLIISLLNQISFGGFRKHEPVVLERKQMEHIIISMQKSILTSEKRQSEPDWDSKTQMICLLINNSLNHPH